MDLFDKLLLIKSLCPEHLLNGVTEYIHFYMGQQYTEAPTTSMEQIYKATDFKTPIIFVLSQGSDPHGQIYQFAKQINKEEYLKSISLGQGQGERAVALIE